MDQNNTPAKQSTDQDQQKKHLSVERQWGQLIGTTIRTFDENKTLVACAKQKAFKLKEEITFWADETQTTPLFKIKARSIMDFGATYDMFDPQGVRVGALRRKGLASTFIQDEWIILDSHDQEVGSVKEESTLLGILRRFVDYVSYFLPQKYIVTLSGEQVAEITQRKNPFTVKYDYTVQQKTFSSDLILCLAIPNLLAIIEARQG